MLDSTDEQPQSTSSSTPTRQVLGRVTSVSGAGGGGDGDVTSFENKGGHFLTHAQVVLIFWGTAWAATPPPSPTSKEVVDAIQSILSSSYMAKLKQYGDIGKATLSGTDLNTLTDPPNSFADNDVIQMVKDRITGQKVPAPNDNLLYCVIIPQFVPSTVPPQPYSSKDHPKDVGWHHPFDMNGTTVYYAWVMNDGSLTGGDSIPKIFSHELVESCTDPDTNSSSGIHVTGSFEGDEIGDACNGTIIIINGVAFQTYWSQEDKLCILPQSLRLFLKAKGVNHVRAVQPSGSVSLKTLMGL